MSEETRDVSDIYLASAKVAQSYDPGEQPDISKLMRSAFMHGHASASMEIEDLKHDIASHIESLSHALTANAALEQAILDKNKYIAALEKRIDDLKGQLSNERMRNPPPLTLGQVEQSK